MAGGAYVPLDPSYPTDHVKLLTEDAELKVLLVKDEDDFAKYRKAVKCSVLSVMTTLNNAIVREQSVVDWHPPAPNISCCIIYT